MINFGNFYARGFILASFIAIGIGTHVHVANIFLRLTLRRRARDYFPIPELVDFSENFSFFKSFMSLITVKKRNQALNLSDLMKIVVVLMAVANHCSLLYETSIALNVTCE